MSLYRKQIEKIVFIIVLLTILSISLYMKDSKIALISALFGVSYTILAGKGNIYCYLFGIISTICYSYISFKNGFYGQFMLNSLYYFPMQIYGIFKWNKNLKCGKKEIVKTKLDDRQKRLLTIITIPSFFVLLVILFICSDKNPIADTITTIFSILGMYLTVQRCIEQWYMWLIVDVFSCIMWIIACFGGANCFATVLMWLTYTSVAIYFLREWRIELKQI